jgi:hypothetical protein
MYLVSHFFTETIINKYNGQHKTFHTLNFDTMETLLVQPKNEQELRLLQSLLLKMNIGNTVISVEDKEDLGLLLLMQKADRSKRVSRKTVMQKLLKP